VSESLGSPTPKATGEHSAKLIESCSDGVEDQGADEAFKGPTGNVTSVLSAVFRARGSPFVLKPYRPKPASNAEAAGHVCIAPTSSAAAHRAGRRM